MSQTTQEIVNEIAKHAGSDEHCDWYVGIAADPEDCLFKRHSVKKDTDGWIYRTAVDNASARAAEDALHDDGFDGGPGGGDEDTKSVYAYKKKEHTSED